MLIKFWTLIVVLSAFTSINAQELDGLTRIKKIKPLISTARDVEKILGSPINSFANIKQYKAKEGLIIITYSSGRCDKKISTIGESYDVEKDTVIDIQLRFDKEIRFKSLKVDLTGFEEEKCNDCNAINYNNTIKGISYSVGIDLINSIFIFPSEQYSYLECH